MSLKTKILFIGNCQAAAIANMLNLNKDIFDISIVSIHLPFDQEKTLELIKNSDIIITQRIIADVYNYAKTDNIFTYKKKETKVILYNSCEMQLYYPDLEYLLINNIAINEPCPYHHKNILDSYKNSLSVDECYNLYIDNKKLLNSNELLLIFNKDLEELSIRYNDLLTKYTNYDNTYFIDIRNFITLNYKQQLLFYSFNHPTNILLSYIAEKIVKILNMKNTIDNSVIQLNKPKCILYSCLSNIVDFDLTIHRPFIKNETNIKNIIQQYYNTYSNII